MLICGLSMDLTTLRTIQNLPEKYHWYLISYINKNHIGTSPHLTRFLPPYCNILYSNCFESSCPSTGKHLSKSHEIFCHERSSDQVGEKDLFTEIMSKGIPRELQFGRILERNVRFQFSSWGLEEFRKILKNSDTSMSLSDNGKENCHALANRTSNVGTVGSKRSVKDEGASKSEAEERSCPCECPCEEVSRSEVCAAVMRWMMSEFNESDDESSDEEIYAVTELQSDIDNYLRDASLQGLGRRNFPTTHNCSHLESTASESYCSDCDSEQLSESSDSHGSSTEIGEEISSNESNGSDVSKETASLMQGVVQDNGSPMKSPNEEANTSSDPQIRGSDEEGRVSKLIRRTGDSIKRSFSNIRNPFKRKSRVIDDKYIC